MSRYELIQAGTSGTMKQQNKGGVVRLSRVPRSPGSEQNRGGIGQGAVRCVPGANDDFMPDDSFREEMIAFLPRLSGFALSLTGNADQRDDLVQETCARALAHRDQWQPGTRLDSWMFRIAQNLWLDRKRSERFRGEPVDIEAAGELVHSDGRVITESRLALAEVLRGLDQLSPGLRCTTPSIKRFARGGPVVADLSDEMLMAYADGMLDAAERVIVEAAIRENPEYQKKVQKFRATSKPVHQAIADGVDVSRLDPLIESIRRGEGASSSAAATKNAGQVLTL